MASLHPTHGARIVLERRELSEGAVAYHVGVYEPGGVVHAGTARITWADGAAVEIGGWDGEPPAWTLVFLERLLKGLPKKHAADGTWPRKITRWREERA